MQPSVRSPWFLGISGIRCTRSRIDPSTYFPISGLSVSMSISSSVNGSSGGIPSSGMPLLIRARNFSKNLLNLNSRPIDAALSTVRDSTISISVNNCVPSTDTYWHRSSFGWRWLINFSASPPRWLLQSKCETLSLIQLAFSFILLILLLLFCYFRCSGINSFSATRAELLVCCMPISALLFVRTQNCMLVKRRTLFNFATRMLEDKLLSTNCVYMNRGQIL